MDSSITLRAVWSDDDILELRATVRFGRWGGEDSAYAAHRSAALFARELLELAAGHRSAAQLTAGSSEIGTLDLSVFEYGRARRLAVEIHVGRVDSARGIDQVFSELHLTAPTEAALVAPFATAMAALAQSRNGEAVLRLLPQWPD